MSDYPQTINFWRGALPHWEVVDGRYFVTLRQSGSLPQSAEEDLQSLLKDVSDEDYLHKSRKYFQRLEQFLDSSCSSDGVLVDPVISRHIETALLAYDEIGYWKLLAFTIMPNHLHMFFRCESMGLKSVMERFKRATGRFIAKSHKHTRKPFWQREWFDHWSRSHLEDVKIESYIRMNPVRAGLVDRPEKWALTWSNK